LCVKVHWKLKGNGKKIEKIRNGHVEIHSFVAVGAIVFFL
jgi:hypothetical protein